MRRTLILYLLALAVSAGAYAQSAIGFGNVTGTIRESYGDGLPDATVSLHNETLGVDRTITTTDDGVFDAPALPPGPGYTLKAARKGFITWQSGPFEVLLGQTLNFRIGMQAQGVASRAEGGQPLAPVDDSKSGVASLVTSQQVDSLPVSARTVDSLVPLAPAVSLDRASGEAEFGGEVFPTAFFIDGNDTTNRFYYLGKPGPTIPVSQDAVEAIQVVSSTAPVEFGHVMGAMVNVATKGGTQGIHGGAYGYADDRNWNALDRYAQGFQTGDREHELGANAGGSLGQMLFLFGNVESDKAGSHGLNRLTNPLLAISNCKATAVQCASVANFLNAQTNVVVPWTLSGLTGLVKMDFRPNELQQLQSGGKCHAPRLAQRSGRSPPRRPTGGCWATTPILRKRRATPNWVGPAW